MEIFSTIKETKDCLLNLTKEGKTIGFVPTMGALHRGHVSLLERAKRENGISVSSIFVNPLQFNDKKDLANYPRTLEQDMAKLKSARCDLLFAPAVEEMYPAPPPPEGGIRVDASLVFTPSGGGGASLFTVMEGAHRPGHFQGVCTVVKKLFDIIEPDKAYFGEKDFQQLTIIKHMVKALNIPVEITPCPTVREADGLAMSSRNTLLSFDERKNAPHIYKTLVQAKDTKGTIPQIKKWVGEKINENPFLQLEYFEIVNPETLQPITDLSRIYQDYRSPITALRACIAVKVGAVRLIDNIVF